MNSSARIAHSLVTRIANNSSLNANVTNNSIVKEDTSMNINTNTVSRIARRAAASLLAFGGLLALSHTAKADVEIYRFVPPAQAFQVPQGSTYVQIKAGNTDNFTVSNLQFTVGYQYEMWPGTFAYAYVQSSVFNLNPVGHTGESLWLNIPVPVRATNGLPFYGKTLSADIYLNGKLMKHTSFADVAPAPNVQAVVTTTGQNPNNGTNTYSVTFTNNGYADATAAQAIVSTWLYGDGQVGPTQTQPLNIKALAVGQSVTLRFSSQPTMGYSVKGSVTINDKVIGTF